MNKAYLTITALTLQGLSYRQAAHQYRVSKSWVHKICKRSLKTEPKRSAVSSDRRHTAVNQVGISRSRIRPVGVSQSSVLQGAGVEFLGDVFQGLQGVGREVCAFREVLAH
jgi:hypothetical protein